MNEPWNGPTPHDEVHQNWPKSEPPRVDVSGEWYQDTGLDLDAIERVREANRRWQRACAEKENENRALREQVATLTSAARDYITAVENPRHVTMEDEQRARERLALLASHGGGGQ